MKNSTFCTPIQDNEVLLKVIDLVLSAKKEIVVTHCEEDSSSVTPNTIYFNALQKKIKEGVKVTRYVFGSSQPLFQNSEGVTLVYAGKSDAYQRAVIVDNSRSMFKLGDAFYYSEFQPLVSALLKYIK